MKKLIKNKLLVLFLTFVLLFAPNKFTFAFAWVPIIIGVTLLGVSGGIWWLWQSRGGAVGMALDLIYGFLFIILPAVERLFNLISRFCATIINTFILLNPFREGGIAMILWDFFRNITYVALVFLGLYAGFNWIINKEEVARSLLLGIILVALIINFTFLLAKEVFFVFWYLQRALLISANLVKPDQEVTELGNLIFAALSFVPPREVSDTLVTIAQGAVSTGTEADLQNVNKVFAIAGKLLSILLYIVYSMIMAIFAGITIGRYLVISFLVGTISIASLAYLIPQYRSYWDQWWRLFLTWNYNLLVLIVLILVGVSLIATTTGAFTSQKLADYFLKDPNVKILPTQGLKQELTPDLAIALGELLKFAVIFLYFVFIIFVGQRLGNVFAFYSYFLTKQAWLFVSGLGTSLGKYLAGAYLAPKLEGVLDKAGESLLKLPLGRFRLVINMAQKLQGVGERLGAKAKEAEEKRAKTVYGTIKGLTPEEQAKEILKYGGALQQQLTKLVLESLNKDKAAILTRALIQRAQGWGKLSSVMQKTLCGNFNCRLIEIQKAQTLGERAKHALDLARMFSWHEMNVQHLESLLSGLNTQITSQEMKSILESIVKEIQRDPQKGAMFFSNYQNILGLAEKGIDLSQFSGKIKATHTYRLVEDILENQLVNANIKDPQARKDFIDIFSDEHYIKGQGTTPNQPLTRSELQNIFDAIANNLQNIHPSLQQSQIDKNVLQNLANQIADILGLP